MYYCLLCIKIYLRLLKTQRLGKVETINSLLSFSNNYFSLFDVDRWGVGLWSVEGLLFGSSDKYIKFSQLYNKKNFQSKKLRRLREATKNPFNFFFFSTSHQNIFRGKLLRLLKKQFSHPLYSFINVYSFTSFKITDFLLYCNASLYPIRILRT